MAGGLVARHGVIGEESRQSGDVEEVEEDVVEPQGGTLGRWVKDAASGEESPRENV